MIDLETTLSNDVESREQQITNSKCSHHRHNIKYKNTHRQREAEKHHIYFSSECLVLNTPFQVVQQTPSSPPLTDTNTANTHMYQKHHNTILVECKEESGVHI